MNEYLIYPGIGLVCLAIGYFLGNYIQGLKTKSGQSTLEERERQLHHNLSVLEGRLSESEARTMRLQSDKMHLGNQIVRYRAELENLREKNREQKEEVAKLQERFTKEFENLANKILEEKSLSIRRNLSMERSLLTGRNLQKEENLLMKNRLLKAKNLLTEKSQFTERE